MVQKKYDTVIYGGRLSGLLAAALLADKGAKVLILNDETSSEKVEKGYKLDFQMLPIGNIPDSAVVTNVLGRLGLGLSNNDSFYHTELLFQIITGKHRIDFSPRENLLEAELTTEFSEEASSLLAFLKERDALRDAISDVDHEKDDLFPPYALTSQLAWKLKGKGNLFSIPEESLDERLMALEISDPLKRIISLASKFSSPLYPVSEEIPFLPFVRGAEGYYPKGGMSGFKKLIMARLKDRDVDIKTAASIESFVVCKNKIDEIVLKDSGVKISAKSFIFNSDPVKLPSLLPQKFFTKAFLDELKAGENRLWWQTVFIGIDEDVIPVGMHDNIIVDDNNGLPFMIQMVPALESSVTPKGKRLLKVSRKVEKPEDIAASSKDLVCFEKDVVNCLKTLIPFIEGKFELIYKSSSRPVSSDDYLLNETLSLPLRLGTLSPLSPYRNLFISGKEIMPVFGIEGDFISAEIIAHNLLKEIAQPEK